MRLLTTIITILLPLGLFSQLRIPKYFLNLENITFENTFILPQNISSINLIKDKDPGEIYILTKEVPWKYKTIQDLITDSYDNKYDDIISSSSLTKIFFIDNQLINDPTIIKIDKLYFCLMTVFDLSKTNQLDESCRKTVIINISLTNEKPKPKILLKGDNQHPEDTLK